MPVEIKELIIRARVTEDHSSSKPDVSSGPVYDKEEIIAECVDQVLKNLNRAKER